MARIYIARRMPDGAEIASRLYDRLVSRYGHASAIKDAEAIAAQDDFDHLVASAMPACNALILIVGPRWLTGDETGRPLLDDPRDRVHREVEAALRLGVPIVPVLVEGTVPPPVEWLPPLVRSLVQVPWLVLRGEPYFEGDMHQLYARIDYLTYYVRPVPMVITPSGALPSAGIALGVPGRPPSSGRAGRTGKYIPLYVVAAVVILALSGVALYGHDTLGAGGHPSGRSTVTTPLVTPTAGAGRSLAIGTDFPVSGYAVDAGLPAQLGVDLAVRQNRNLGDGYTLSVVHKNDSGPDGPDPTIGAANVGEMIADPAVMGIVGPFNSGIAAVEIPLVEAAGLVEISPSNTNPGLTIDQYASRYAFDFSRLHPAGSRECYFRVVGNDVVQGQVDATIARSAGAKTAFVVDDGSEYGTGLADFFTQSFQADGGHRVGARTTLTQSGSLSQVAVAIKSANPDVVFYGGLTAGGGAALKLDLVQIGYTRPMYGGDGIADDPDFIHTAGTAATGTMATAAGPDTSSLTSSAAEFVQQYQTAFPGQGMTAFSALAYDAAMTEITAIKKLIQAGKAVTRAAIRDEVASIQYAGVTGRITFDQNGDIVRPVFSIYAVDASDTWTFVRQTFP